MPTFSELSVALDKAIQDVQTKKKEVDSAEKIYSEATIKYNKTVENAINLRTQINNELNNMLPGPTKPKIG